MDNNDQNRTVVVENDRANTTDQKSPNPLPAILAIAALLLLALLAWNLFTNNNDGTTDPMNETDTTAPVEAPAPAPEPTPEPTPAE